MKSTPCAEGYQRQYSSWACPSRRLEAGRLGLIVVATVVVSPETSVDKMTLDSASPSFVSTRAKAVSRT